jgi:hypothetical protein
MGRPPSANKRLRIRASSMGTCAGEKQVSETGLCDHSETGVNPSRDVIEEILYGIRILPRELLAGNTGCDSMSRSFDRNEILIGAGRDFVVKFIIPDEIVPSHSTDEYWHRDILKRARSRIVAGAPINLVVVQGVRCSIALALKKELMVKSFAPLSKSCALLSNLQIRHPYTFDNLRYDGAIVFDQFLRVNRAVKDA